MRESIVGDCLAVTVQDHSSLPLPNDIMHDVHLSAVDRYKPAACNRMSGRPLTQPSGEPWIEGSVADGLTLTRFHNQSAAM